MKISLCPLSSSSPSPSWAMLLLLLSGGCSIVKQCHAELKEFTLVVHHQDVDMVKFPGTDDEEAVSRLGTFINGTYPGPTLEVNLGDTVHVKVINDMPTSETTIHFHGQHQVETYYYDGVPHTTQCAIAPHSSFEYKFVAEPAGTFFYHSHVPFQMGDGVFGAFIVHDKADPYADMVDDEVVIGLSDWLRYYSDQVYQYTSQFRFDFWPLAHYVSLMNGEQDFQITMVPGSTYRLRFYAATIEYGYRVFMTGDHTMTVIAADGSYVNPTETNYLDIYSGERYDVLITADQDVGTYVLIANVVSYTGELMDDVIYSVVTYEGSTDNSTEVVETELGMFNNSGPAVDQYDLTAYQDPDSGSFTDGYKTVPGPNELLPDPLIYDTTSYAVQGERQYMFMDSWDNYFNTRSQMPLFLLSSNEQLVQCMEDESRELTVAAYSDETLTHSAMLGPRMEFLELGETVDIIFRNTPSTGNEDGFFGAVHPMHIHGHYFWAIASGDGTFDPEEALKVANFVNPPLRDNVVVRGNSWVWVGLEASNPGLWLMHCHSETHAVFGMMTTLVVGTAEERPVPPELTQCGRLIGVPDEGTGSGEEDDNETEGSVSAMDNNNSSATTSLFTTESLIKLTLVTIVATVACLSF